LLYLAVSYWLEEVSAHLQKNPGVKEFMPAPAMVPCVRSKVPAVI
jgi:hypothetical protein